MPDARRADEAALGYISKQKDKMIAELTNCAQLFDATNEDLTQTIEPVFNPDDPAIFDNMFEDSMLKMGMKSLIKRDNRVFRED